jgi:hypothetical protein
MRKNLRTKVLLMTIISRNKRMMAIPRAVILVNILKKKRDKIPLLMRSLAIAIVVMKVIHLMRNQKRAFIPMKKLRATITSMRLKAMLPIIMKIIHIDLHLNRMNKPFLIIILRTRELKLVINLYRAIVWTKFI